MPARRAILPKMMKTTAAANRTRPESVTPTNLFESHAVIGHAATPDRSANQPFVSGHGPRIQRSPNPPPPATMAHVQAATQPSVAPTLAHVIGSFFPSALGVANAPSSSGWPFEFTGVEL